MPALKTTRRTRDHGLVLLLDGEIDMATEQQFHHAVAETLAEAPGGRVVLDCARLSFIDSSGLRVLIQAHRSAREDGSTLAIAAPSDRVAQILRVTAIDTRIPVFPTADAALAAPLGSPTAG
jgi:anti-sigma B factor antagonist